MVGIGGCVGSDDGRLDGIIVAAARGDWVKVAVFIAQVIDAAKAVSLEATGKEVAERIYALVEGGELEAQGNVRRWRAACVRRKA